MKTLSSNTKDISRELYERFDRNSREIELYEMIFVRNIEICNCLERVSYCFWKGDRDTTVMMFMWLSGY